MLALSRSIFTIGCDSIGSCRHVSRKAIKGRVDYSLVPQLNESEISETFAHGSGPGGQKVNKSHNCVILVHKPTGIVVKNHEFRELKLNRKRAREIMITKLDNYFNGDKSVEAQVKRIEEEAREKQEAEAVRRRELKKRVKELWERGNVHSEQDKPDPNEPQRDLT